MPTYTITNPSTYTWSALVPGDIVIIENGTYTTTAVDNITALIAGAVGTELAPITIRAETPNGVVFTNIAIFLASEHVILDGIRFIDTVLSAAIIQQESHAISIIGCRMENCAQGVYIGGTAGDEHIIRGNIIVNPTANGIAIDQVNARDGFETRIEDNLIETAGIHGIEVNGSYYIVTGNFIYGSGRLSSGCSGIHTFAQDDTSLFGKNNIIAFNVCADTQDTSAQDGNGIQADQWCNDCVIAFNICYGNDGAGISIFDASRTVVAHNTLVGNMLDPGVSHAYTSEITLASDFTVSMPRPSGNLIANNVILARAAGVRAIWVEATAGSVAQEISGNLSYNTQEAVGFVWAPTGFDGTNVATWNSSKTGAADSVADPLLASIDTESHNRFRPQAGSPALGSVAVLGDLLSAGLASAGTLSAIGALSQAVPSTTPVIAETVTPGTYEVTSPGLWTHRLVDPAVTYQWTRDTVAIGGATSTTYAKTGADGGTNLRCEVAVAGVAAASNTIAIAATFDDAINTFDSGTLTFDEAA